VKPTVVALAAAALLAAGAAAVPPGPPQIKESLTPLPCPKNPKTTLQLQACAGQRILRSDAEINKRVRAIWGLLRTKGSRARFAAGERTWLAYRRATCLSRSDAVEAGSLAKLEFANCVGDMNRTHVRELGRFQTALQHH
jgi:uncharacterized protein YecT (DUF1311 family)